jgi:hypothetical protein
MKSEVSVQTERHQDATERGMIAAIETKLREELATFRCATHGEAPRLVPNGTYWDIEGCCTWFVEGVTRSLRA